MSPATWPREDPLAERMLLLDAITGEISNSTVGDLQRALSPGDVIVVNDAATLPASLAGTIHGAPVEARLAAMREDESFTAVLLGAGDYRTRTEDRPPPPRALVGDTLRFHGLSARVVRVHDLSPRLVDLEFSSRGAELANALYQAGKPVQYAHVRAPLELWHVQTAYASRPWAVELPSAGRPLTWVLLNKLRAKGVTLAWITHAAGLTSTGDAAIDRALPFPERYEIPESTVRAIGAARARGGRVIAIGTSAVRALEGRASENGGGLTAGSGTTAWRGAAGTKLRVVDGILTGVHARGESHFELLRAFTAEKWLDRAFIEAERAGYLAHEFGDAMLIVPGACAGERSMLRAG